MKRLISQLAPLALLIVWLPTSLISFLLLAIAANYAHADKIKLRSVDGFFDATVEVVGVVGTKTIIKEANGDTEPIPLAELDKDSLIRITAELGRQMKASPKDIASNFARADKIKLHSVDGFFDTTAEVVGVVGTKIIVKEANGDTGPIPLAELDKDSLIRIAAELGRQMKGSAVAEEPATIIEVVAVGTGLTSKAALEDAFRNAAQQVVGLYVDAETLIKNDELVEDKVLTYSDGFVKKYDEISVRKKDGLVKIKILAKIERRSVIAKLKAANITTRKIDGKGLFAEAVTNMAAKKGATALLKKALADFPTLVTAESVSEPKFDQETSEVVIDVLLKVDTKAYTSHQKRLEEVLAKICLDKSSLLIKAGPANKTNPLPKRGINPNFHTSVPNDLAGPPLSGKTSNGWTVWVNSFRNATHTSTRWNGYVVDADVAESIKPFLTGQIMINVALLDAGGELITEDEFKWVANPGLTYTGTYPWNGWDAQLPFIRMAVIRHKTRNEVMWQIPRKPTLYDIIDRYIKELESPDSDKAVNLYVAPYSFTFKKGGSGNLLLYQSQIVVQRRIKVTLDELKQVADIKCKTEFRPHKAANK